VVESAPAAGEYGEAVFAQAAQSAEQGVVGAVVHGEYLITGRSFDRGVHADTRAFVAGIGQRR